MSRRVAFLVIACILVSVCFGSPIKEVNDGEPNTNSIVVQLNVEPKAKSDCIPTAWGCGIWGVPEVDAITTNLENLQFKPAQKIEEDSENEDETENETGGGTMDCIPTPYGCIDLNDPSLRP